MSIRWRCAWFMLILVGCAGEDEDVPMCTVAGLGTGRCCELQLGGDPPETGLGACLEEGICTNGAARQPNEVCGEAPEVRDRGIRDPVDLGAAGEGGEGGGGEGGGVGGAGGMPDLGPGGEGGEGGAGGNPDPCANVVCDPGQRCVAGTCVSRPAGPCESNDQCPDGAECILPDQVSGGFCRFICSSDDECDGGACLAAGDEDICFDRCDGGCREGWTCLELRDENGEVVVAVCQPDCRDNGCGAGQACNEETGLCQPACPYPCQAGETCTNARCVRDNLTCVTDYHCEEGVRQCHQGQCVIAEFTDCAGPADCAPGQTCVPTQDGGLCLFGCQTDADCPFSKMCYPGDQICYFSICGPARGNGQFYGACTLGADMQTPGTCQPVPVQPGEDPLGICFEAGNVAEGGACNAQNTGRTPADRALQCGQGSLCFGDPDDDLDPSRDWAATGECARMCDPRNPVCGAQRSCVDFSRRDDPATPQNDANFIGLCLTSDCQVIGGACGAGQHCRPYSFVDNQGACGPAGQVPLGQPCEDNDACAAHAICANAGDGPICLQICDLDAGANACPAGQQCVSNPGWAFGACL